MTLHEIASSEEMRNQIKIAIEAPAIEIALRALEEDNMPELAIKAPPGMDIMDVIALDAAKRAGAQSVIRRLRRLPYLTINKFAKAQDIGRPWEYLGEEETLSVRSAKPKTPKS